MIWSDRIRGVLGAHSSDTALALPGDERLMRRESRPKVIDRSSSPAVGERVRVCRGVLAGAEGTVIGVRAPARVLIAVDLVEQGVSIEVDAVQVEVAGG